MVALVTRHLRTVVPPRAKYRLEVLAAADPVLVLDDHPLVSAAGRALQATWGKPPAYLRSGGTIPVVAELRRRFGMPAALWGLSAGSLSGGSPLSSPSVRRIRYAYTLR